MQQVSDGLIIDGLIKCQWGVLDLVEEQMERNL